MRSRNRRDLLDADRFVPRKQRDQRAEEVVDVAFVEREQELVLAREVEIHRALGKTGLVGDFGHVRDAHRRTHEKAFGCVEDRVVPLVLVFGMDCPLSDGHGFRLVNDFQSITRQPK